MDDADILPIKRYETGDRLYVQAQRIWLILVAYVQSPTRRVDDPVTITYGDVALLMGHSDKHAGYTLSRQLGIIRDYCERNNLPALNAIVVNQNTGKPGEEVRIPESMLEQVQAAVMAEDWFALRVPSTGTLRKVWEAAR